MNILVFEDYPQTQAFFRINGERCGWNLTLISNPTDRVLRDLSGKHFNTVFVDYSLPTRNGPSVLLELEKQGITCDRLILMSSHPTLWRNGRGVEEGNVIDKMNLTRIFSEVQRGKIELYDRRINRK